MQSAEDLGCYQMGLFGALMCTGCSGLKYKSFLNGPFASLFSFIFAA